ncbi:unnamed protein product [Kuraishia capsulata CBS 1993]|uniref:Peroxisome assembly protein 12 n=1 Tax=Kuraishia capsulata CBS 1993 TaxID=1382522 RepID=W6MF92_9ASCO|nr:uncharacterized protein KUCA_T00000091001 [Kuraishia capsulata CBS 1993]CDK24131.1 unnamed protein product [Kuraishia capsulata CBS 1993]
MDYYSNLSGTFDSTPTLFEIISSNELQDLLSPSLRYVLIYYTHRYPHLLLKFTNRFDELNLLLRGLIEYRFLKKWNSTFTEKFYGLKRQNSNGIKLSFDPGQRLTKKQIYASWIELMLAPYLKEKLDVLHEYLYPQALMSRIKNDSWQNWLRLKFIKLYPIVKAAVKLVNLVLQLLYLSGDVKSPSLIMWLLKINYSRFNSLDYERAESGSDSGKLSSPSHRIRPVTLNESLYNFTARSSTTLRRSLMMAGNSIFPAMIFSLKIMEWWNSSDFAKLLQNDQNLMGLKLAPPMLNTEYRTTEKECPLCKKELTNPSIIETGYVFCHSCIFPYLQEHGKCPITEKHLHGCKWNESSKNWDVLGVRKLIL